MKTLFLTVVSTAILSFAYVSSEFRNSTPGALLTVLAMIGVPIIVSAIRGNK